MELEKPVKEPLDRDRWQVWRRLEEEPKIEDMESTTIEPSENIEPPSQPSLQITLKQPTLVELVPKCDLKKSRALVPSPRTSKDASKEPGKTMVLVSSPNTSKGKHEVSRMLVPSPNPNEDALKGQTGVKMLVPNCETSKDASEESKKAKMRLPSPIMTSKDASKEPSLNMALMPSPETSKDNIEEPTKRKELVPSPKTSKDALKKPSQSLSPLRSSVKPTAPIINQDPSKCLTTMPKPVEKPQTNEPKLAYTNNIVNRNQNTTPTVPKPEPKLAYSHNIVTKKEPTPPRLTIKLKPPKLNINKPKTKKCTKPKFDDSKYHKITDMFKPSTNPDDNIKQKSEMSPTNTEIDKNRIARERVPPSVVEGNNSTSWGCNVAKISPDDVVLNQSCTSISSDTCQISQNGRENNVSFQTKDLEPKNWT